MQSHTCYCCIEYYVLTMQFPQHCTHWRRKWGESPSWIWKISAKNVVFLVSSGKKQISPLLATPGKILEKSPWAPLEKILPTPMTAHVKRNPNFCTQLCRPHMNENSSTNMNTIHMKGNREMVPTTNSILTQR